MRNIDFFNVNKVASLEEEVTHLKRQLTRKTNLHNKTADRLAEERMKRRHFKGRAMILQNDVDVLEEKVQAIYETETRNQQDTIINLKSIIEAKDQRIKQHEQIFREDEDRYSEIVSTNRRLHEENVELKNDIIHLIRQSRKES